MIGKPRRAIRLRTTSCRSDVHWWAVHGTTSIARHVAPHAWKASVRESRVQRFPGSPRPSCLLSGVEYPVSEDGWLLVEAHEETQRRAVSMRDAHANGKALRSCLLQPSSRHLGAGHTGWRGVLKADEIQSK